jgi:integrase
MLCIVANNHPRLKFRIEGHRVSGKRRRLFFRTRAAADLELTRIKTAMSQDGEAAFKLSLTERTDAVRALEILRPFGKNLVEAAERLADYAGKAATSETLGQLAKELYEAKKKDGASDPYLHDIRKHTARLCTQFGDRPAATVETRELDDWLRRLPVGPVTRNNVRRIASVLFGYAVTRGAVERNPVQRCAKAKEPRKPPAIWTPEEVAMLLAAAVEHSPHLVAGLAIGFFSGIRDAEILRLEWSDVKIARGFIDLRAEKSKTARRRLVKIEPCLAEWLRRYIKPSGPVVPAVDVYTQRRDLCAKAGLGAWRSNALRHSFASYHLAQFHDAARTALELGHTSPTVVFRHYREVVTVEDAARFWNILPPAEDAGVIPFPAAATN